MLQDDRVVCDVLAYVRSVCESVCDLSIDFASYWVYSPLVIGTEKNMFAERLVATAVRRNAENWYFHTIFILHYNFIRK